MGVKGFSVRKSKGFQLRRTEYKDGRISTNARLYYNRGKWTLGPKSKGGQPSSRTEAVWANLYYEEGGMRQIERVYSQKYRAVQSTENVRGVRTNEGIGWLTREGRIITDKDMQMTFRSLDKTTVGGPTVDRTFDVNNRIYEMGILESKWISLTARQKALVVDELRNVDWEEFWKQFYPSKDSTSLRIMYQMYDDIVMRINNALSRA